MDPEGNPRTGSSKDMSPVPSSKEAEPPLDFEILREWYLDRPGGSGLDPRRSPETIARRLNISPATVRRRMTEWRSSGFFRGYDVLPHPGLLGGRLAARLLDFPDPISQERAIPAMSLIDGVVQIVPSRNLLMVVYVVDSEAQSQRRLRQLRALEGPREVGTELTFAYPPCSRRMSLSDWRLVRALRRSPEAGLAALAEEVGQSTRTTSRRFDALLGSGAVIFDPMLDYSRFSQNLGVIVAFLDVPESLARVQSQIRALVPHSAQSWGPTPLGPAGEVGSVQFLVCSRTAAELDGLTARVAHMPGVSRTLLWCERSSLPVRDWLDERIEGILREGRSAS